MRKFLIFLFVVNIFAYELSFTEEFNKDVKLDKNVVTVETDTGFKNMPFNYYKSGSKYILFGDKDKIDEWNRNSGDVPEDAFFSNENIGVLNLDKWRMDILKNLKERYPQCDLKKVQFLNNVPKIYETAKSVKLKVNVTLECR